MRKAYLIFAILIASLSMNAQMTLEFNTNFSDGTTITLPLYGSVNVTVDWGDGNIESYTTTGDKDHTYTTNETYTVSISGTLTQFGNSWIGYDNSDKLIKVTSFGNLGLTNLSGAFKYAINLIEVPSQIPSSVTDLSNIFESAENFDYNISGWDVQNVTDMSSMLMNALSFNQDIGSWNTSNVTDMAYMFYYTVNFNQNIGSWNANKVTSMEGMFNGASSFNQDIGNWNVSNVSNMEWMFGNATSFDQDLGNWSIGNVTNMDNMFIYIKLSTTNYNNLLIGWSDLTLNSNITFHAGYSKYSTGDAETARNILTNAPNNWTIADGGISNLPLIKTDSISQITPISAISGGEITNDGGSSIINRGIVWNTDPNPTISNNLGFSENGTGTGSFESYINGLSPLKTYYVRAYATNNNDTDYGQQQVFITPDGMILVFDTNLSVGKTITLPLYGLVSVNVDWGDGVIESYSTTGYKTHTFATEGIYTVGISGTLTQFGNRSSNYDNAEKLIKVTSIDNVGLRSLAGAFNGAKNLIEVPSQIPSTIYSLEYAFCNAENFNYDIGAWNVSNITDMRFMFDGASTFTQDISNWDVSKVNNMRGMFKGASSFNQNIENWNVSKVTDMGFMFSGASDFNQPIGNWDVGYVTDMRAMFYDAPAFNQNINNWNVSKVSEMALMFSNSSFNSNIGSWNVSNVTSMEYMFYYAKYFNQNIGSWDVSKVTKMSNMFYRASAFNQPIGNWDVSNATDMKRMFYYATNFNNDIGNWNVGNVTSMESMFENASAFNQNIGSWNVSNVNNMRLMFAGVSDFNQPIGNWNVDKVTDMAGMFARTPFNQDIGNWNVSKVINMSAMFSNASDFNKDIGNWNVSNTTNMSFMFSEASAFNKDISNWDVSNVTDMNSMFSNASKYNQPIGNWNVSEVTNMRSMFSDASSFNKPIGNWNVSKVTNMYGMFYGATLFNQKIENWNVSKVTDMSYMFRDASNFNQKIESWEVSNVIYMGNMFAYASAFDQFIGNWNVSKVTDMNHMFIYASSFNQDISNWNVRNVTNMGYMLFNFKISTAYYNKILINWSLLPLKNNVTFHGGQSKFSTGNAANARQYIIDTYGWTITDGGMSNLPAVITDSISDIEFTTATSGGEVTDSAGSTITERGIVWNTTPNPTTINNLEISSDGSGIGTFSSNLTSLNPGEEYYVRAYATNGSGTDYGNIRQFIPQQELTLSGDFTANNKTYDGDSTASVLINNLSLGNIVSGHENVSISDLDLSFAGKNIGLNKTVKINDVILSGSDSLKYNVLLTTSPLATAHITTKELTVNSAVASNKIYNGNINAEITDATLVGKVSGDDLDFDALIGDFSDENVGTSKIVTTAITISGTDAINYSLKQPTGLKADITTKELTISGANASDKIYDGNTNAQITGASLVGIVSGDNVALNEINASFSNKNIGTNKTINPAISTTGADASNYSLSQPSGLTADITAKELTISGANASDKIYDGNTDAEITSATLVGTVSGDNVDFDALVGDFSDENVGTSKTVTPAITISGTDAINYSLNQPTDLNADITTKELTISGANASDKIYNGNTNAEITGVSLIGTLSGDDISLDELMGNFSDKNVGANKSVNAAITITGANAGNYNLTQPSGLTANITTKELTVSGASVSDKIYDGTTDAKITGVSIIGTLSGDDITLDESVVNFSDKNVGTNKSVAPAITITGSDAGNYILTQPNGLSADITEKELAISGSFTVLDKDYDGNTTATIDNNELTLVGTSENDDIILTNEVAEFSQSNIAVNIVVNITSAELDGTDKENYSLSLEGSPTTTANILAVTSTNEISEFDIKIYPNPFVDYISFESNLDIVKVIITNLTGQKLLEKNINGEENITTSHLPSGVYFLVIKINNSEIQTFKIIKQ
jgi:surface protein